MPHKTHCPQGHEYTPENTYLNHKGYPWCRICARERSRDLYDRQRAGSYNPAVREPEPVTVGPWEGVCQCGYVAKSEHGMKIHIGRVHKG